MGFLSKGCGHRWAQSFSVSHAILVSWRNNLPVVVDGTVSLFRKMTRTLVNSGLSLGCTAFADTTLLHMCVTCLVCPQADFSPRSLSSPLTNLFSNDAYLTTFQSWLLPQQCEGSCLCFAPTSWGRKELDTTEQLSTVSLSITPGALHFSLIQTVENKNSCSACGE